MNRTKKLISDAFWEILEEKPFNRITVQNIVECCQVNRNTFLLSFSGYPCACGVLSQEMGCMTKQLLNILGGMRKHPETHSANCP